MLNKLLLKVVMERRIMPITESVKSIAEEVLTMCGFNGEPDRSIWERAETSLLKLNASLNALT